ncbi:MAG: hypothetical protein IBX43_06295 [Campylobacterales bacterium]|nr:hypothetical protein [Campylobacterales bacterium]
MMNKSQSEFLELVKLTPAARVLEVSSHADELSLALAEHLSTAGGELHLQLYPGIHQIPLFEHVKAKELTNFSVPFQGAAREYATVILRDVLDLHEHPDRLVKIAYKVLLNASELIIVQKKSTMELEQMLKFMHQNEFRAANDIDIFEEYYVVVGKKMHMWGNGL